MENFTPLPTANPEWGFWGTSERSGYDVDMTWNAVSQILSSEFELTPEQTRDLLDSTFGRHLSDDLSFIKDGPSTSGAIYTHIRERLADWKWRGEYEKAVQAVKPEQKVSSTEQLILQRDMDLAHFIAKFFKGDPALYNHPHPEDVDFHFSEDDPLTLYDVKAALTAAYAAGFKMGKNRR